MFRIAFLIGLSAFFGLTTCDSWAMGHGGGRGFRGGGGSGARSGLGGARGRPGGMRGGGGHGPQRRGGHGSGGIGTGSGNGSGKSGRRQTHKTFNKWPLPEAVTVEKLDLTAYEKLRKNQDLTSDQIKNMERRIESLKNRYQLLVSEQQEARLAYQGAMDRNSATAAAKQVMRAAQQAKAFKPNRTLTSVLKLILSKKQFERYGSNKDT